MFTIGQRFAISVGAVVCIALVLALWPMPEYKEFAPPTPILVLAATWFGPLMLLVIPALAIWISFGAETHERIGVGIGISMALLVLCVIAIWYANAMYRSYYGPIGAHWSSDDGCAGTQWPAYSTPVNRKPRISGHMFDKSNPAPAGRI